MQSLLQDLRYATRVLAKSPGFTLAAIAGLTLGIGMNTIMFSVVDSLLLRPLPYADADRLLMAQCVQKPSQPWGTAAPDFRELRERNRSFSGLAAYYTWPKNVTGTGSSSTCWAGSRRRGAASGGPTRRGAPTRLRSSPTASRGAGSRELRRWARPSTSTVCRTPWSGCSHRRRRRSTSRRTCCCRCRSRPATTSTRATTTSSPWSDA